MKTNDIFSGAALDKYLELMASQSQFSSGAESISAGRTNIPKWKMVAGDSLMVVPVAIHVPFNPVSGARLGGSIPILGSVRFAIRFLKVSAKRTPAVAEALKAMLGEKYSDVDWENTESVTAPEVAAFNAYRQVVVYAATVMAVRAADSKFPFGTPYRVNIAQDPETHQYIDDINNPLIYQLHKFESACLATMAASMKEANEAAGDARRTEDEMKDAIKRLWDSRCISNPYSLGITRVINLTTNRNYEVDKAVVDAWKPEPSVLQKFEVYIKVNKKTLDQFNAIKDSKYDRYEDFLLVKVHVDEFTDDTRGTAAQGIGRSGASSDDKVEDMLSGFINTYRDFRDDVEKWNEKVIMSSAWEYRTISDDTVRNIFASSMPALETAMKTPAIVEKYAEVVALVDQNLSSEMLAAAMADEVAQPDGVAAELEAAPVITEDTPGYGGDSSETNRFTDNEDVSSMLAALREDDDM